MELQSKLRALNGILGQFTDLKSKLPALNNTPGQLGEL